MTDIRHVLVPVEAEIPPGAMSMVELWRWAERQCCAIADEGEDPTVHYPLMCGMFLLKPPQHVERDRVAQVCFLNGVPADV